MNTFTFELNNLKALLNNKGLRKEALTVLESENPTFEGFQFSREKAPKRRFIRSIYPVAEGLRICLSCVKREMADGVREEQAVMAATKTVAQSFTSKGGKVYDKCTPCRSAEAAAFHNKPEQVRMREQRKAEAARKKMEEQFNALAEKLGKTFAKDAPQETAVSAAV